MRTGLAGLVLASVSRIYGRNPVRLQRLLVRFQTDPDRIARMLPAPLTTTGADVWLEYLRVIPEERTLIEPGPFAGAALRVEVEYDGERGWFEPLHWSSHEWGRLLAREYLGLAVKQAEVVLETEGSQVRASVRRHGALLHRLETNRTDEPSGPSQLPADLPTFVFDYRLDANWRRGLPGSSPESNPESSDISLWRIPPETTEEATDQQGGPASDSRRCDPRNTVFEWPTASAADPVIEFPVKQVRSVTFEESSAAAPASPTARPVWVTKVPARTFQPSSLVRYDRPVTDRQTWTPTGWRDKATAWKLSRAETGRYAARKELRLGPIDMIDIRLSAGAGRHPNILPPPCLGAMRHVLRILAFRVEASDLSPVPFSEAWLLAYCVVGRARGWYALSHIVGEGGDVVFGREVFGYPSKSGEIDVVTTPQDFVVEGRRLGRQFCLGQGAVRGMATGVSLSQLDVIGLRPRSLLSKPGPADLITQRWHYQGRFYHVDRPSLTIALPEQPARGLTFASDPWFELGPFEASSASVIVDATMQRGPGEVLAQTPDFLPYYAERCDGVIPGVDTSPATSRPSFLARPEPLTRSALRDPRA